MLDEHVCAAGRLPGLPILGWPPRDTTEDPDGPLMDISLDLEDPRNSEAGYSSEEECGPLMDVSLDLDDLDDLEEEILDAFDVFDPEHYPQYLWDPGADTESEPELQTPTFTPPFRPLSTISVTSDVELDPQHRVKLPLAAVGASFVRRLAANGLRC